MGLMNFLFGSKRRYYLAVTNNSVYVIIHNSDITLSALLNGNVIPFLRSYGTVRKITDILSRSLSIPLSKDIKNTRGIDTSPVSRVIEFYKENRVSFTDAELWSTFYDARSYDELLSKKIYFKENGKMLLADDLRKLPLPILKKG